MITTPKSDGAMIREDIDAFLERHEHKELLRFVTIGSVDDGKSTLIGRLLHDTQGVYEDQLDAVRRSSSGEDEIDFALITDGLQDERQQGITIDVAYRYFSTTRRKFIIADTPGHVQYTRNMATGASTAELAVILIDARLGVLQQSRRHAFIASLLGIPSLAVAVNKMDLVDFDPEVFEAIRVEFEAFSSQLGFDRVTCFPVSALMGDHVVEAPSPSMPWYEGPSILEHLETVPMRRVVDASHFALPVQYVIRPDLNFRGFAGSIASGTVRPGDEILSLPSGKRSRVREIVTFDGPLEEAFAPMAITLTLEDEIDISRGDMIVHPESGLATSRALSATLVWMNETPLELGRQYFFKHTTRTVTGEVSQLHHRISMETLESEPCDALTLNEIGEVSLALNQPLIVDLYTRNRAAGAFIIIDRMTNITVGAGVITEVLDDAADNTSDAGAITPEMRARRFAQRPALVRLPGDAGAIAEEVSRRLFERGHMAHVVDAREATVEAQTRVALCLELGVITLALGAPPSFDALAGGEATLLVVLEGGVESAEALLDELSARRALR